MNDKLFVDVLGLLPKNLMSRAVGAAAHAPLPGAITRASIRAFARMYDVDLEEAEQPLESYATLGEFFARRLRLGARPIDRRPGVVVSPADGKILNFGVITDGTLLQAKGRRYRLDELLGDNDEAAAFINGSWATVYLSPRDYHRVHHPVEGEVRAARHIPGHLWPVNNAAVTHVADLFCVNERLVTYVDSPLCKAATVMVGATSVGHITAAYDPSMATNRGGSGRRVDYTRPARVARGDELGTFHLGSTAIVLFARSDLDFGDLTPDAPIRMGQALARTRTQK